MSTNLDISDMDKDFRCTRCKGEMSLFEIAFLGSKDDFIAQYKKNYKSSDKGGDFECSPFTPMVCVCSDCIASKIKKINENGDEQDL